MYLSVVIEYFNLCVYLTPRSKTSGYTKPNKSFAKSVHYAIFLHKYGLQLQYLFE